MHKSKLQEVSESVREAVADNGGDIGLETCSPSLNDLLGGGLRNTELKIVHARGKHDFE